MTPVIALRPPATPHPAALNSENPYFALIMAV